MGHFGSCHLFASAQGLIGFPAILSTVIHKDCTRMAEQCFVTSIHNKDLSSLGCLHANDIRNSRTDFCHDTLQCGETLSSHRKIVLLKAKIGNHILFFENVM